MPSIIVFSKDRPMQLHAYLESLFSFSDVHAGDVTILFRQTPDIDYSRVISAFPNVHWVKEQNFHSDLVDAINASEECIMFGCDDVVFTGAFNLNFAKNVLSENEDIFGFSFRLGNNIQPQPKNLSDMDKYRKWGWFEAKELHYNYPWELDCTLYRKSDIQQMLHIYGANIKSPNYFEGDFAVDQKKYIFRPNLACLNDRSKALVITVNAVQDTHQNGFDDNKPTDIHSLNNLYNKKNNKLDIEAISKMENRAIHVGAEYFLLQNYDENWEREGSKQSRPKKSNPLKMFVKNIGYLFKYDLKKIAKESISLGDLNPILDGIKYEIVDESRNFKKPKIKTSAETIEALIKGSDSFCRFGDGEFLLINGENIAFQNADARLTRRLIEIIQSDAENILIGIPHCYYSSVEDLREFPKSFIRTWVARNRGQISGLTLPDKQYYDTACTQLYALYQNYDFKSYFERIKEIWRNRDITIICGKTVFDAIEVNIFDCAKSVEYQYAPSLNAFEIYDDLLMKAKQISKERLVIAILGPTATVLAYDLAREGYQAIDFGHIAKDYDFYSKKIKHNSETISNFLRPD